MSAPTLTVRRTAALDTARHAVEHFDHLVEAGVAHGEAMAVTLTAYSGCDDLAVAAIARSLAALLVPDYDDAVHARAAAEQRVALATAAARAKFRRLDLDDARTARRRELERAEANRAVEQGQRPMFKPGDVVSAVIAGSEADGSPITRRREVTLARDVQWDYSPGVARLCYLLPDPVDGREQVCSVGVVGTSIRLVRAADAPATPPAAAPRQAQTPTPDVATPDDAADATRYRTLRDRIARALFVIDPSQLGASEIASEVWAAVNPAYLSRWRDRADRFLDVLTGPDLIAERAA